VITFYNTWLGLLVELPEGLAEQEQDQQRQLDQMLGIITTDHPDGNLGRMIVGGTFNNTPASPLADKMRAAGFVDPFAGLPLELSATLWRTGIRARVDFLWVRPPLTATSAGVMDTHPSDHRMAVIEVQITRR
jgi:endonuclease/exonuclease/phosphatase (EEP) superfamily protein YafD